MEMVKTSVQRKAIAPVAQDDIERSLDAFSARQQFIGAAVGMGWQLALMVIVPVIIGVQLDDRLKSSPSYTLAALVLAVCGGVYVVRNTIKQVNKEQSNSIDKEKTS